MYRQAMPAVPFNYTNPFEAGTKNGLICCGFTIIDGEKNDV